MDEQTAKKEEKLSPHKILVIDDDMWMQRLFSKYLVDWGFRPLSAYDAYEGIALAIKMHPLVIFLDIVMPEVKGEILLKMLKSIDLTADIPVVIVSANFDKDLLSETYKNGASGFLSKPFTQKLIYDSLKKQLSEDLVDELRKKSFKILDG